MKCASALVQAMHSNVRNWFGLYALSSKQVRYLKRAANPKKNHATIQHLSLKSVESSEYMFWELALSLDISVEI